MGIRLWVIECYFKNIISTMCSWAQCVPAKKREDTWILSFPFRIDGYCQKDILLAETNNDGINWLSKLCFQIAVRTSAKSVQLQCATQQVIGGIFEQLEDALKENNARQFNSARNNLIETYKQIEFSLFFTNDKDEPDNWLLLPESAREENILDLFIQETISVAESVTRRIHDDTEYYESWCYLYPHLFSFREANPPAVRIAERYLSGHYQIWKKTMSLMDGINKQDSASAELRDRVIKDFIGSWERWGRLLNKEFKSVKSNEFLIATHHVNCTSYMIIHACKYSNTDAARWATDTLIYWFELFTENQHGHHYGWHHELINLDILQLDSDHALRKSIASSSEFNEAEVTVVALRNYWIDIRYLTAAYLLATSENKREHKQLIEALVSGNRLEPTRETEDSPRPSAKELLGVYLRQYGRWDGQFSYSDRLERHLEGLVRIERPARVPNRLYIVSGSKKEQYFPKFFQIMGIGLTNSRFSLDQMRIGFLKSDAITYVNLKIFISELKTIINIDASIINAVAEYFDIEQKEAKEKSELFIDSITESIAELEAELTSQIINAPLDEERLRQFGVAASGSTFTVSNGPMPLALFQDVKYINIKHFDGSMVKTDIVDYRKSVVSKGIQANIAINEDEWLNNIVSERAAEACFQQLLKQCPWKTEQFEDAISLIRRAVDDGQSLKSKGLTPVMFIGPWNVYELIDSSRWQHGNKEKHLPYDISVEINKPAEYVCHLAGIEIYRFPFMGEQLSVLLGKEAFKKMKVKHFERGKVC